MKISILTLFPEMFTGPFDHSIIKRAQEKNLVEIKYINIRDFGEGKHKMVDDTAYGGGVGMVMKVDVLHRAIEYAKKTYKTSRHSGEEQSDDSRIKNTNDSGQTRMTKKANKKVILLSASGKPFIQQTAKEYSQLDHLILICGHYEGIDDRIKHFIDEEISIGDFVLTGGELPAMLITDAVTRLISGVLPIGATENESFSLSEQTGKLLEYPHFTKPQTYEGFSVPEVLLSGDHKKIADWKKAESLKKTKQIRPDLLK